MPLTPLMLPVLCPRRSFLTSTTANLIILLLFAAYPLASTPPSDYLSFSFSSFGTENSGNFTFSSNANKNQGALQVTPDTLNNISYVTNRSGRILLSRPFRLWKEIPSSGNLKRTASFNTSFSINIYRRNNTSLPGEGLTFLIAPDAGGPPPGSYGGYLGLTNATIDGHPSNRFVAIEFDTFKQPYDPDDNHIGLDINGVVSNITTKNLSLQIAPIPTVNYTVWIDYDGGAGRLLVFMIQMGNPKPKMPVLNASLDISDYVNQDSYFGFSAATGEADYELNCVLAWNLTVENLEEENEKNGGIGWKMYVGIAAGVLVLAIVAGLVGMSWYSKERRKRKTEKHRSAVNPVKLAVTLKTLPGMPKEYEYKELRRATNGFDESMKLGQGGFGTVYRGVLQGEEGREVAVKKFSRGDNMNNQDDFLKELTVINQLRHKNLLRLLGWCHENGVLLLVYDYMPNGSLDQHLYNTAFSRTILTWIRRVQVASDVASALHYLHQEYNECVIHRDIKSSNVMLDATFRALLGDFGLARVINTDKTSYAELEASGIPGTLGYIAPECFITAKSTRESDVFAFGALLLELVCGRRPHYATTYLADRVWMMHQEGRLNHAIDDRLGSDFDADKACRLLLLGLACSHPLPGERPNAASIMQVISGSLPPPTVPLHKPAGMWPAANPSGNNDSDGGRLTAISPLPTSSGSVYKSCNNSEPRISLAEGVETETTEKSGH